MDLKFGLGTMSTQQPDLRRFAPKTPQSQHRNERALNGCFLCHSSWDTYLSRISRLFDMTMRFIMTTKISLIALGALALLPLSLPQAASAQTYDINRDRAALHHDYAVRNYDARREYRAERNGNWWAANIWRWRKIEENREIAARRADLRQDYRRYDYRGY
jgi:hypothetical protein